jgi:hypothetical protein
MMGSRPLHFEHLVRQLRTPYPLWDKKVFDVQPDFLFDLLRTTCSKFSGFCVRGSTDYASKEMSA